VALGSAAKDVFEKNASKNESVRNASEEVTARTAYLDVFIDERQAIACQY
jgi:hypothetical protein